jgi:hypothetical protein
MAIRVVHYTKKDMALSIYLRDLEHAKVSGSGHGYNFGGCCPKKAQRKFRRLVRWAFFFLLASLKYLLLGAFF